MRVIAGEFRSRRLKTLPGLALRPTPDRLRQALFNVVANEIKGSVLVDAYAGSGSVGIEALSRGAERAIFLENHRSAIHVIYENLATLGIEDRAAVVAGPVLASLSRRPADIVFLDPPYELSREYYAALELLGRAPPPLVVAQHPVRLPLEDNYIGMYRSKVIKQGFNVLSFFRPRR